MARPKETEFYASDPGEQADGSEAMPTGASSVARRRSPTEGQAYFAGELMVRTIKPQDSRSYRAGGCWLKRGVCAATYCSTASRTTHARDTRFDFAIRSSSS